MMVITETMEFYDTGNRTTNQTGICHGLNYNSIKKPVHKLFIAR